MGPRPPFDAWSLPEGLDPGPLRVQEPLRYPESGPERIAGWLHTLSARPAAGDVAPDRARRLGRIGATFLDPTHPRTRAARTALPRTAGLSPAMVDLTLARMAETWTEESLQRLLETYPEDARRPPRTPQLHIGSGSVPGVTLTSCLRGLLVGGAVLAKPGRGDVALTVIGRRILADAGDPLADRWAVAYWPGEAGRVGPALQQAEAVVLYGDDETVAAYRAMVPAGTTVVAYPHRASAALVTSEARDADTAEALAAAVAAYDRRGCVSPRLALVIGDDQEEAAALAANVARALAAWEARAPAGPSRDPLRAHRMASLQLREAAGEPLRIWTDPAQRWAVILDAGADPPPALPEGRAVRIRPVADMEAALRILVRWGPVLQTVGVAGPRRVRNAMQSDLGHTAATRVCALEDMPWPPAWWRHDGRSPLEGLVR